MMDRAREEDSGNWHSEILIMRTRESSDEISGNYYVKPVTIYLQLTEGEEPTFHTMEAGGYEEVVEQIGAITSREVMGYWRRLYRITEGNWMSGDQVRVQFDEPTHLIIGDKRMDMAVRDVDQL
jgi:hypothetical protein